MDAQSILRQIRTREDLLNKLVQRLRAHSQVLSVRTDLSAREYASGPMIEAYVECELTNGMAAAWTMDIAAKDGRWHMRSHLVANDTQGQFTLYEYPEEQIDNEDDALKKFEQAAKNACQLEEQIDRLSPFPETLHTLR